MIKDRLAALKAASYDTALEPDHIQISMDTSVFMEDFFARVTDIRTSVASVQKCIGEIRRLHDSVLSAPTPDDKINGELEERMTEVKTTAQKCRLRLKELDEEAERAPRKPHGAEYRIKKTQHAFLSHVFTDVMAAYNSVQIEHRDNCKRRIQRQLEITGKPTDDAEIERMLESGNAQIFSESFLIETKQAKQTLADISARHRDIIKLEKSILELHDMFVDMALLVESQGEMVDNIEKNVISTVDFVKQAEQNTSKALEHQRAARKKKIIIIVIGVVVVVVLVIILIVVLLQYIPKNNSNSQTG